MRAEISTDVTIYFEQSLRDMQWTNTLLRGYQNLHSYSKFSKNFHLFRAWAQQFCTVWTSVATRLARTLWSDSIYQRELVRKWDRELVSHSLPTIISRQLTLYFWVMIIHSLDRCSRKSVRFVPAVMGSMGGEQGHAPPPDGPKDVNIANKPIQFINSS